MHKVTTINLNGKAYQVEEAGYDLLKEYLEEASQKLGDIPDKKDVLTDFEQAIAEKADKRLNFHKTVLTESEIKDIIEEMGPVEGEPKTESTKRNTETQDNTPPAKRLYRVREGKVLAGICNGFAAYFGIDVVLVRVIFILLALVTQGLMVFLYIIAIFVIPPADNDEKLAAAYGVPFNAQEVLSQAKQEYKSAKQSFRSWKRDRKRQWREAIRQERIEMMNIEYPRNGFMRLIFGLITIALTIGWIAGLVSLFETGGLFGTLFFTIPVWVTAVLFTIAYGIIVSPFSDDDHYSYGCGRSCRRGSGFMALLLVIFGCWALYQYVPEARPPFDKAGQAIQAAGQVLQSE